MNFFILFALLTPFKLFKACQVATHTILAQTVVFDQSGVVFHYVLILTVQSRVFQGKKVMSLLERSVVEGETLELVGLDGSFEGVRVRLA